MSTGGLAGQGDDLPLISDVVRGLGPHALQTATDEGLLERTAGDPVIMGPGEPVAKTARGLLLLTGGSAGPRTRAVVRSAAQSGYGAVVVKALGSDLTELVDVAQTAGIALLITPDEMGWRHLDALLTSLRDASAPAEIETYGTVGLGDLFALANAIASVAGGAVTIEDPRGQVMAYSNLAHQEIDEVRRQGILGRQTPEYPSTQRTYGHVLATEEPVFVPKPDPEVADRWAVTVRAGAQVLGMVWVLADRPPVIADVKAVLADAGRATALHLLRARGRRDPERWRRSEVLRSVLDGSAPGGAAAAELGLAIDQPTVVLGIAQAGLGSPGIAVARTIDLLTLYCEFWHPRSLCVTDGDVAYALLPTEQGPSGHERLRKLACDIATASGRAVEFDVLVGIGSAAPTLSGIRKSRRTADRVLAVLKRRGSQAHPKRDVASVEDVRIEVLLHTLLERGAADSDLLHPAIGAMQDHDQAKRTVYVETLLTYLGTLGDVTRAAASLTIHENTMRYRLRRIQELFDIDLADSDGLLTTWLQLRLLALAHDPA